MKLAKKSVCTGCQACSNLCTQNAIKMKMNEEGFFFPRIDGNYCIKCEKCLQVCPEIRDDKCENRLTNVYAAFSEEESIRINSSSGGIFTMLAAKIIENDGVVFGAEFGTDFSVKHSYIQDISQIHKFRNSKYVQSFIGKSFRDCKNFLDDGKWVLFSGTSCQIEGLYQYLDKNYNKLITIDLICSGNTSPGLWEKYLQHMKTKYHSEIKDINFRDKKYGWDRFSLRISFTSGKEYRRILPNDPWAYFFLHHQALRESCYHCRYKKTTHRADFTLGDFWGVQRTYPKLYDDKGLSFVMIHSQKGRKLWEKVNGIKAKEIPLKMVEEHNLAIIRSASRPENREDFFADFSKMNFYELEKKYVNVPFWKKSNMIFDYYSRIRLHGGKIYRRLKKVMDK